MFKIFSKILTVSDLLVWENRLIQNYRNVLSKSKPSLYILMNSSKLFKEVAALDLMRSKDVTTMDLLHIVKRSHKYRQDAGERLVERNKLYCSLNKRELQLLIDKSVQIEWAKERLEKK